MPRLALVSAPALSRGVFSRSSSSSSSSSRVCGPACGSAHCCALRSNRVSFATFGFGSTIPFEDEDDFFRGPAAILEGDHPS